MNKKTIILVVTSVLFLTMFGITYAWFSANVSGNNDASMVLIKSRDLNLVFKDGQEINLNNAVPGDSDSKIFTVTNRGDAASYYSIEWINIINDFENKSELVYTLELIDNDDSSLISTIKEDEEAPSTDSIIESNFIIQGKEKHTHRLTIKFKNLETEQNLNQGKTFSGKINISGDYKEMPPVLGSFITSSSTMGNTYYSKLIRSITVQDSRSGLETVKYCTTTSDSCVPSTNITINKDKTIQTVEMTFGAEALPQRVCINATNEMGDTITKCDTETFKVDTSAPTGVSISLGSTTNIMNITGTDSQSGIQKYVCEYGTSAGSLTSSVTVTTTSTSTTCDIGTITGTVYVRVVTYNNANLTTTSSIITTSDVLKDYILVTYGGANAIQELATTEFANIANSQEQSGLFKMADDYGTSYYFRGHRDYVNNNVIFAGFQWKIIRINGDGSVRLIYNGTEAQYTSNGNKMNTTGTNTQIGTSAYNSKFDDNAYVGYKYGASGQSTYAATHANTTNSNIKTVVETWYTNNLANKGTTITNKIVDEIFCNDRQPSTSSSTITGSGGYGKAITTYYAAFVRIYANKIPKLTCTQANDKFTVSASNGNGSLTYPVGLITFDEASFVGGAWNTSNNEYYLSTDNDYWTMSPYVFNSEGGGVTGGLYVNYVGGLSGTGIQIVYGVRPVINLSSTVKIASGNGTSSNPYRIS